MTDSFARSPDWTGSVSDVDHPGLIAVEVAGVRMLAAAAHGLQLSSYRIGTAAPFAIFVQAAPDLKAALFTTCDAAGLREYAAACLRLAAKLDGGVGVQ